LSGNAELWANVVRVISSAGKLGSEIETIKLRIKATNRMTTPGMQNARADMFTEN
jgi:hypothetical protein